MSAAVDGREVSQADRRVWQGTVRAIWVLSVILFVYVAWASRLLRPGADDYCFAVDVDRGVLGGLLYWFQEISGYFTFLFGAMAFVGWPLRHLPLALASSIPFLVAAVAVGTAGAIVYWSITAKGGWRALARSLAWVPAIAVGWWAFLWLPVAQGSDGITRWMANGVTHWQTLNGTYVLQTACGLSAALLLWAVVPHRARWAWAFLPLGAAMGFGGAALVLTVAVTCSLLIAYTWLTRANLHSAHRLGVFLLLAGVVAGGLASHFSPGTQSRSEILGTSAPTTLRAVGELVNGTLPWAITTWVQSFAHTGGLLLLASGITMGWLLRRSGPGISPARGAATAVSLLGMSLLASLASRFTELFAYEGYWHFIIVWLLSFFGLLVGSLSLGARLAEWSWTWETPFVVAVAATLLLTTAGALLSATTSMASRALAWEAGPAPLPGMVSDLENPVGMEIGCWVELSKLRDLPPRGQS